MASSMRNAAAGAVLCWSLAVLTRDVRAAIPPWDPDAGECNDAHSVKVGACAAKLEERAGLVCCGVLLWCERSPSGPPDQRC